MLHAPGYNGQEALIVRSKNGPKEPLRPSDIVRELFLEAKKYYGDAGVKATEAEWERLKEPKEAIRETMSNLEEYGVAQRTDAKGTPFSELTTKQRQQLPSGRTRMFFWLFPRTVNPARALREWEQFQKRQQPAPPTMSPDDVSIVEVGFPALPVPPIWQILKVFQIEKPEKALINDPDYQQRVERARVAARAVFLEVVLQPLPVGDVEVGPQPPPKVGPPAGALESKVERQAVVQPVREISSSSTTTPSHPADLVYISKNNSPAGRPVEWHAELREFLETLPVGTALDEPMFERIAKHLSAPLLPQFKTEAEKAKNEIRKWPGYETKAKQVAARGLVKAATANGESHARTEDPILQKLKANEERRRVWQTS